MPLARWMQILGITHYILGALASIATALAVAGIFWVSATSSPTTGSPDAKLGIDVAMLTFGAIALCLFLLLPITFLLGNRLFCRRWRVVCIVMAVCELLWSLFPGGIVAFIFFTELSTLQSSSTTATILSAALSAAIPAIPIALSIATLIVLSIPSTAPSFAQPPSPS